MSVPAGRAWLIPLSVAFGCAARVRLGLYERGVLRRRRLSGPVISVGNLGVGGSGKTPVVARIAALLREEGCAVAVLSRGYGGSFRGDALVVSDGRQVQATPAAAGDEPVLLARRLPGVVVAVGPRRDAVGRHVEARFGPRVHVLDDGFQHLRLARELDVLCVDGGDLEDWPLPVGRLREFPSAAARADLILMAGAGVPALERLVALERELGLERTFLWKRRVEGFFDLGGLGSAPPSRPFLFSGIARPERFEADVASRVPELAGVRRFRDHHAFSGGELEALAAEARRCRADALVTTAKDAVRLPGSAFDPPLRVLEIAVEIDDERAFRRRLLAVVRRAA